MFVLAPRQYPSKSTLAKILLLNSRFFMAAFATAGLGLCGSALGQTAHFVNSVNAVTLVASLTHTLSNPPGIALDGHGNLFIVNGNTVLQETPTVGGYAESTIVSGLSNPTAVATDYSGNVYIADTGNSQVVMETPVGDGTYTQSVVVTGIVAAGVAADRSGNVYVTDPANHQVVVETPVGDGSYTQSVVASGFTNPSAIGADASGTLFVGDSGANQVLMELPVGDGTYTAGPILSVTTPGGIAVDASDNLYITDVSESKIIVETAVPGNFVQSVITDSSVTGLAGIAVDAQGNIFATNASTGYLMKVQTESVNMDSVVLKSTGNNRTLLFAFDNPTSLTLGSTVILTQGASGTGLDFADLGTGSCASGQSHVQGDTCTVNVSFNPKHSGPRNGAVELMDNSGNVIATAYVSGTGLAPQIGFSGGDQTPIITGLSYPTGLAVDGSGNIYIADSNAVQVTKTPPGGGSPTQLGTGLNSPFGVAVDGAGNVYIADFGNRQILKEPWTGSGYGPQQLIGTGFGAPVAVTVDGAGNVSVLDSGTQQVIEIPWTGNGYGLQHPVAGGMTGAVSLAIDGAGSLYISDAGAGQVTKAVRNGTGYDLYTALISGMPNPPAGVAVDGGGNVYIAVADPSNAQILKLPWTGSSYGQPVTTEASAINLQAIALDGQGNIYFTDTSASSPQATEIDVADPPTLAFDPTTVGQLSVDSPRTATVFNNGNEDLIFAVPTMGTNPSFPADFSLFSGSSTPCPSLSTTSSPSPLSQGTSCDLVVGFLPTTGGLINESLALTDNALNAAAAVQHIGLIGAGIYPPPVAIGFFNPPPALVGVGGNAGVVKVKEIDGNGNLAIATDSIELDVTGPGGYSQSYTVNAVAGIASFDLTGAPLSVAGTYSYQATSTDLGNTPVVNELVVPATTTTIAITSAGNAISTAAVGTTETLTATVTDGATPVTPGQVIFCDTSVNAGCTGGAILGTAQLAVSGTATLTLRLTIGAHTLKAIFTGTTAHGPSASAPSALTVTGFYATTTVFSSSPDVDGTSYDPTARVISLGPAVPVPTGTVTFLDTSNGNASVGTALLSSGVAMYNYGLGTTASIPTSDAGYAVATGDFNGDGIIDLVSSSADPSGSGFGSVFVALGNGDGTFQAAQVFDVDPISFAVAVGDFNGDGKLDIASVSAFGTVSILLGKGDGTFHHWQSYNTGNLPVFVATGDFNGDGILDIATVNNGDGTVSILLGNGDGTFQDGVPYNIGSNPFGLVIADFNGDGILDIAATDSDYNAVSVLLGNGDGTFQNQVFYPTGDAPAGIGVADFNGDGKLDLAVVNTNDANVVVLSGNGDGTFGAPSAFSDVGGLPARLTVLDYNGDGKPDVAVANNFNNTISVLLGKGDGTFHGQRTATTGLEPFDIVAADFNGDGLPDLATANIGDFVLSVVLNKGGTTTTVHLPATALPSTDLITAGYSGDAFYAASTSAPTDLQVATTLRLTSSANPVTVGDPVTLTAKLSPFMANGQSTDGETITFKQGATVLGTATLTAGTATSIPITLPAGPNSITASYPGDAFLGASTKTLLQAVTGSTGTTFTVTKAGSAVTAANLGDLITLTATVVAGGVPVTPGVVNFCDLSINASCSGPAFLGSAQLNASGVASLSLHFPIGTHSLEAAFPANIFGTASVSSTSPLVVSGLYETETQMTFVLGATPGVFDLTATITGGSYSDSVPAGLVPTGTLDYLASTTGASYSSLTTAPVSITSTYNVGLHPIGSLTGHGPNYSATGDFNGDGKQDVAVVNLISNTVSVLLGNGDGTFQTQVTYNVGLAPTTVETADLNSDGKLDLVVANEDGYTVSVLLGNGDGTFQPQVTYNLNGSPYGVKIGDFNHDGVPDLAVGTVVFSGSSDAVEVLLGNGDGTFKRQHSYDTGFEPDMLALGDFDGDGNLDIATANYEDNTISILLGLGDGTFQSQQVYATGDVPSSIVTGDLNGDGHLDLVITDQNDNDVSVLLGNGDGTFGGRQTYDAGNGPAQLRLVDMNGDGKLDLAVANGFDSTVSILLGNGDGTFQSQTTTPISGGTVSVAVADFNGDGSPDLAVTTYDSHRVYAALNSSTITVATTVTGVSIPSNMEFVKPNYSGDSNFQGGDGSPIMLTIPTTLTLTSSANPVAPGTSITLTATLAPFSSGPQGTDGEAVNFYNGATLIGTSTLTSGMATLNISTLPRGTDVLTAVYAGDTYFLTATSAPLSETVSFLGPVWVLNVDSSLSEFGFDGTPVGSSPVIAGGSGTAASGGVAFDNAGQIWSVAPTADHVVMADKTGASVSTFTGGGLSQPVSLAIDGNGAAWIANSNNSVSVFANAGTAITPSTGYTGGNMSGPSSIAIDISGNVWISNAGNDSTTEILGGAAPVAPLAVAVQGAALGAKP